MNDHRRFEAMAARRHELTPPEAALLSSHLDICDRCRDTAESYLRQDAVLQPLAWQHSSEVRRRVLAKIDKPPQKSRLQPRLPVPSVSWLRGLALPAALALVTSGIVVNVSAAQTGGSGSSPLRPWTWVSCNAQGYALLSYKRILTSPSQFRGPHVIFIKSALIEARDTVSSPTYYVFPRSPSAGICRPNMRVTAIVIAVNTRTGAELDAVGLASGR